MASHFSIGSITGQSLTIGQFSALIDPYFYNGVVHPLLGPGLENFDHEDDNQFYQYQTTDSVPASMEDSFESANSSPDTARESRPIIMKSNGVSSIIMKSDGVSSIDLGEAPRSIISIDKEDLTVDQSKECHKQAHKSIVGNLGKYQLPAVVVNAANQAYLSMTVGTHRGTKLRQLLYHCTYNGCLQTDHHWLIPSLQKIFDLTDVQVQRTNKMFSPVQTGYYSHTAKLSTMDVIASYCNNSNSHNPDKLNITNESSIQLVDFSARLVNRNPFLRQINPETAAAACLNYYFYSSGITCERGYIERITGRSSETIETLTKQIISAEFSN